jgi:membrane-associated protease RseP (regulator of RpoE activity)
VRPARRRYWLHALLFAATIFSTLVVGARLEFNFLANLPAFSTDSIFPLWWVIAEPSRLLLGVPFSATLMLILLAHEMGHFVFCKRYGVRATLPFFLPAPTLIGTLGAFIRIKSPIPSRRALFDIGIAGPIAGFVVALPALALGMWLSRPEPLVARASEPALGYPAIFHLLWAALPLGSMQRPPLQDIYFHPVAIAAWVGMLATALNLLPSGQLDGGHIVYAVAPRWHRWISRMTVFVLLPLGVFYWVGWLVWGTILTLLGPRHPQLPLYPDLGRQRQVLALLALVMLILTFMPAPLPGSLMDVIREYQSLP